MTRIRIEKGTGGWGGPLELDVVEGKKSFSLGIAVKARSISRLLIIDNDV